MHKLSQDLIRTIMSYDYHPCAEIKHKASITRDDGMQIIKTHMKIIPSNNSLSLEMKLQNTMRHAMQMRF